jgi:hypothetical protein
MNSTIANLLGWLGAAGISAAPFIIDQPFGKWLAIVALAFLAVQGAKARLWNIVGMNIIGIIGYGYALFG